MSKPQVPTAEGLSPADFPQCPICANAQWVAAYAGPVRDGAFGNSKMGQVARCAGCGIERLAESLCVPEQAYAGEQYRNMLGQGHDLSRHFDTHDELARFTLDTLWPTSLRGKVVIDVGCGGGSLLDHVRGICASAVAVEPDEIFGASLKERGYPWYRSVEAAAADYGGKADTVLSVQVIEHVENPRQFLAGIKQLLAPSGMLLLSTPNRRDIMLELLPDEFSSFYYRSQHRWYFDRQSLGRCAEAAGLRVIEARTLHRYGMANALLWLRDRKPSGRARLPGIDSQADALWRAYLDEHERGDNLYLTAAAA